ncbi:MAG: hypothetical protein KA229_11905, partial [Chitinophagaceae bacterium]|nr:hypothetical protein [Chitinophagaceae bacterium]
MHKIFAFVLSYILISQSLPAQTPEKMKLQKFTEENTGSIIDEYARFLYLPNVASDPSGQQKNAAFIMEMMKKRGIQNIQLLNASTANVPPVVYGEVMVPGATQTLIFYAHYDGQPVNPAQWAPGLEPFVPKLFTNAIDKSGTNIPFPADGSYQHDWRIYARGAADDKAGIGAILNAYD